MERLRRYIIITTLIFICHRLGAQEVKLPRSVLDIDVDLSTSMLENERLTGIMISVPPGYSAIEDWLIIGGNRNEDGIPSQAFGCRYLMLSSDGKALIAIGHSIPVVFSGLDDNFRKRLEELTRRITVSSDSTPPKLTTLSGEWVKKAFEADSLFIYEAPTEITLYQIISGNYSEPEIESIRKSRYPYCDMIRLSTKEGWYLDMAIMLCEEGKEYLPCYIEQLSGNVRFNRERMREIWQVKKLNSL